MRSRKLAEFFLILLLFSTFLFFQPTNASAVSITRTFSSLVYDGDIEKQSNDYLTAYYSMTGGILNYSSMIRVGQDYEWFEEPHWYDIIKAFLFFDTSMIPDTATITAATLSIDIFSDASITDFNVTLKQGFPITSYPHIPLEEGDYYYGHYVDVGGSRNTSEISGTGYWNITVNAEGLTWINIEDGITRLALTSSRWGIAPTNYENIGFWGYEAGETISPKLYVTYTTEGFYYIVHGGYYESGAVANCIVNVTVQLEANAPQSFILNGTDGVADTVNVTGESRAIAFTWNISSEAYNHTRVYYLEDKDYEELWIYVRHPDETWNLYSFNVIDMAGINNGFHAYLSLITNVAGIDRVVERRAMHILNAIPFWMCWQRNYKLRVECDKGTYTWTGFLADQELEPPLVIQPSMFPLTIEGFNATANAARKNATWIQANYTDGQTSTSSLIFTIQHREDHGWMTDYTENVSDTQAYQVNWYSAVSTLEYRVQIAAQRSDKEYYWTFFISRATALANPLEGFLDVLGKFPVNPAQFLGIFLIFAAFALGSYADHLAGLFLGVLVAAILNSVGLVAISWTLISAAGVVVGFIGIALYKRSVKEYET